MSIRYVAAAALAVLPAVGQGCATLASPGGLGEPVQASADRPRAVGSSGPTRHGLPAPAESPSAPQATRTHGDDPMASRVGPRPVSDLYSRDAVLVGAVIGGLAGASAVLEVRDDAWGRPQNALERAAIVLFSSGLGAGAGMEAVAAGGTYRLSRERLATRYVTALGPDFEAALREGTAGLEWILLRP